ncbi:MAG: beta-galactosidase trimerization domain-containing protein [Spirochaetes bacterium]|nr:beta-galactosidase trimerization domain-containing protein [Spirochaetota bacterium]
MHQPKYAIFYDFHTQPDQPDVGKDFDVDGAVAAWKSCGVDYVIFHARCNLGTAYYDTQVGIRHPSLTYDLLGKLAEACAQGGVALGAYFNVGLSHEEGLRHREWTVVTPEGQVMKPNRMDHFMRGMCYNTGYAENLLAMVEEVASRYPIAGFFFDCFTVQECVGVECVQEMKRLGIDWADETERKAFAHTSQLRLARRLRETALAAKPDLLLYFNGVNFEDQLSLGNYNEFECLPTGGWGYELLPAYARYLRTLGKPAINMTGRFHRAWGDFGGLRTAPSLEFDCVQGLSQGMRPSVGDHWHPRGERNDAVFDLIRPIYRKLQSIDAWVEGARPQADVALVVPPPPFGPAVLGATRMLAELQVSFDVVTSASQWGNYTLLILPDELVLDGPLAERIRAHLGRGGAILASAWAGLDADKKNFVFQEWGVTYAGEDPVADSQFEPKREDGFVPPRDNGYFRVEKPLSEGLPDMPLNAYVRGAIVEAAAGSEVLAHSITTFFPRHWDGEHHHLYLAPDRLTQRPVIVQRGKVAYLSHPFFTAYHQAAPVPLKQIVARLLERLHPQPLLRLGHFPSFGRSAVTSQAGRRMVWLMNYVAERRGASIDMIEEAIETRDVEVRLRMDGRRVRKARLLPIGDELPVAVDGAYARVTVPALEGWAVVVFEE